MTSELITSESLDTYYVQCQVAIRLYGPDHPIAKAMLLALEQAERLYARQMGWTHVS